MTRSVLGSLGVTAPILAFMVSGPSPDQPLLYRAAANPPLTWSQFALVAGGGAVGGVAGRSSFVAGPRGQPSPEHVHAHRAGRRRRWPGSRVVATVAARLPCVISDARQRLASTSNQPRSSSSSCLGQCWSCGARTSSALSSIVARPDADHREADRCRQHRAGRCRSITSRLATVMGAPRRTRPARWRRDRRHHDDRRVDGDGRPIPVDDRHGCHSRRQLPRGTFVMEAQRVSGRHPCSRRSCGSWARRSGLGANSAASADVVAGWFDASGRSRHGDDIRRLGHLGSGAAPGPRTPWNAAVIIGSPVPFDPPTPMSIIAVGTGRGAEIGAVYSGNAGPGGDGTDRHRRRRQDQHLTEGKVCPHDDCRQRNSIDEATCRDWSRVSRR